MRFSTAALAAGLAPLAFAHPLEKRQNALPTAMSDMDRNVLQLANYLENLEHALYTGGYENFTDAEYTAAGFPAGFRENVGVIAQVGDTPESFEQVQTNECIHSTKQPTPKPSAPS